MHEIVDIFLQGIGGMQNPVDSDVSSNASMADAELMEEEICDTFVFSLGRVCTFPLNLDSVCERCTLYCSFCGVLQTAAGRCRCCLL